MFLFLSPSRPTERIGEFARMTCPPPMVPRTMLAVTLLIGGGLAIGTPSALAQALDTRGSLGGYGGSMANTDSRMGGNGGPVIPYGGKTEGFMPYRLGGGSTLSYQSRSSSSTESTRPTFSLSPMLGGTSSLMSGGMGQASGSRTGMSVTSGLRGGMGLGSGMGRPLPGAGGRGGVMPPSFAYPFRQPPSPFLPSGAGMSM
jgi:hypothetical protein